MIPVSVFLKLSALMLVPGSASPQTRALIVGGGPSIKYNQVGIESNVRYVERLFGDAIPHKILFADGDPKSLTVLYIDDANKTLYREPKIKQLDGASQPEIVKSQIADLATGIANSPKTTALLYFTGHGTGGGNYDNNEFGMWKMSPLTVTQLAADIQPIPKANPVVVVMVQCFSGGFANLLFADGNPKGEVLDRDICGFFSSVAQRMSAGCQPTTNESDYHDFSGYFFAALSGTTRMGTMLSKPDYNHDGKVGMNEAFAYSLISDVSMDTPVCTSDAFLRRFVPTPDATVFATPYAKIKAWAGPSQLAALEGLSDQLKLTGEDRAAKSFADMSNYTMDSDDSKFVKGLRFVRLAKSVVLAHTLETGTDKVLKDRFHRLIDAESKNPLVD
ncbi:hypothetical protein BH11ARM1_BH11ARM1_05140 [soil metagenome]